MHKKSFPLMSLLAYRRMSMILDMKGNSKVKIILIPIYNTFSKGNIDFGYYY